MVIPPSQPAPLRFRAARGLARGPLARSLRQHRRRRGRVTAARLGARNGSLSCPATPPAPQTAAVGAGARVAGEGGSDPGGPDTGGGSDANLNAGAPAVAALGVDPGPRPGPAPRLRPCGMAEEPPPPPLTPAAGPPGRRLALGVVRRPPEDTLLVRAVSPGSASSSRTPQGEQHSTGPWSSARELRWKNTVMAVRVICAENPNWHNAQITRTGITVFIYRNGA